MFILLPWESAIEFDQFVVDLKSEYGPKNRTELILVERMASTTYSAAVPPFCRGPVLDGSIDDKRLAFYLRYETTHERTFHKMLRRAAKDKSQKEKSELDEARFLS